MSVLFAALALAAQGSPIAVEPYRARGSNPPWSVTIGTGRISYEARGEAPISVETPSPVTENGITRYEVGGFRVSIMPIACTDKASGRRYSESVMVSLPRDRRARRRSGGLIGENLRGGCGGAELPADSLNGTSWHFAEIAGESTGLTGDLLRDDVYAVDFSADGLKGYGGCNMFRAGYSQADGVLTVKLEGSTTGVCREPVMGRERRLLQILSEPVRISFPDAGTMVLTGEKGAIRLTRTKEED